MDDELRRRAEARIGSVISGKYRLDAVLGVGGMAVVYAATHRNQKRVALKMLHAELSLNSEVRARFMREGYAANTVDHPGAVAVLDDDTAEDGSAFLVMERLEGEEVENLWQRRGRRFDARASLALAEPLLAVLEAAHAKGIVHRDIKPANLYITRDGTLKVLDFGIARARDALSGSQRGTQTGMLMGTPAFMAPEQAMGRTNEIDGATDVWAVGATMFALLSGEPVHDGDTSTALLIAAATHPARSLALAAPGSDPLLVALVDRALAFDKRARWATAAEMRGAVREVYAAMFGGVIGKEPLAELLATPTGYEATMMAPSVSPPGFAPPPVGVPQTPPSVSTGNRLSSEVGVMASTPVAAWGPPGTGASWQPPALPSLAPPPPERRSLLAPALVLGVSLVAAAGVVAFAMKRSPAATPADDGVAAAQASASQAPVVSAAPSSTAEATAMPGSSAAPPTDDVPEASGSAAPPDAPNRARLPGPLHPTVVASPPAPTYFPPPPSTAPTVVVPPPPVATPAATPAPPPAAVAPAPICKAQCVSEARACKATCKSTSSSRGDRHDCDKVCSQREKSCRASAGC